MRCETRGNSLSCHSGASSRRSYANHRLSFVSPGTRLSARATAGFASINAITLLQNPRHICISDAMRQCHEAALVGTQRLTHSQGSKAWWASEQDVMLQANGNIQSDVYSCSQKLRFMLSHERLDCNQRRVQQPLKKSTHGCFLAESTWTCHAADHFGWGTHSVQRLSLTFWSLQTWSAVQIKARDHVNAISEEDR